VIADINAIPPLGVEGLDAEANGKEVLPYVFGIGALTIGKLKNKIEAELIKKASEQSKGIFDYKVAYEIAKQIIFQKREEQKKTETEPQKYWLP
jgi:methylene-tetrahydromethanopterin dehydrogenase